MIFRNQLDIYKRQWPLHKSYTKIHSTILVIKFGMWDEIIDNYCEEVSSIYSQILDIIDLTVFEHFGELISFDNNEIVAVWDNTTYQRKVENHSQNNSPRSSEHENEDSLKEEYESYEVSESNGSLSEISHNSKNLYLHRLNTNHNLLNDISNFIMICVLKLLSRINYNPFLISKLKKINRKNLDIQMSLHRGCIYHIVASSSHKIETRYIGKNITRAISIHVGLN